ncbi:MAG TPA: endonuclease [Lactobacillus acetotolerans]|jgi:5-methylcytosine-specific restriction endonuclease McrA|nr:endonuclease [Lactobacillus acetotolerans]
MGKWQDVYGRKLWKIRRKQALRRDKYKCQWCLEKGIIRGAKEVHHIVHLNKKNYKDSRIAYGLENLVSLCENCHKQHHNPTTASTLKDVPFPIESSDTS